MSTRKISDLELISTVGDDDFSIVVQGGVTKRFKPKSVIPQVDKNAVGLGNVDNFATAGKVASETGLAADLFMTPAGTKDAIAAQAPAIVATAVAGHAAAADPHPQYMTELEGDNRYATPAQLAAATAPADRYDLKVGSTTGALDLNVQQVFTISATTNRTITFANVPSATRSMTVVVELQGKGGTITWPTISWNGGVAPVLGNTLTVVVLLWTGSKWIGSVASSV